MLGGHLMRAVDSTAAFGGLGARGGDRVNTSALSGDIALLFSRSSPRARPA